MANSSERRDDKKQQVPATKLLYGQASTVREQQTQGFTARSPARIGDIATSRLTSSADQTSPQMASFSLRSSMMVSPLPQHQQCTMKAEGKELHTFRHLDGQRNSAI